MGITNNVDATWSQSFTYDHRDAFLPRVQNGDRVRRLMLTHTCP